MITEEERIPHYNEVLARVEGASRLHAATKAETKDWQVDRAEAIVEISGLGVPRSTVAKLTGLTRGRVQQILEDAGKAGITGEEWRDPELRRLVAEAIAARPEPSIGIGLRRESASGPHIGRGLGVQVRLNGEVDENRARVVTMVEKLLDEVRSGKADNLLKLSTEELEVVEGNLIEI